MARLDLEDFLEVSPQERIADLITPEYASGSAVVGGVRVKYSAGTRAGPSGQPTGLHCYWRKPDGEIVVAGFGDHEFKSATMRGMQSLQQYGVFPLTPNEDGWQPHLDPYREILANGGIKEFTRDQIMAHRWHVQPHPVLAEQIRRVARDRQISTREAILAVMPQLKEDDLHILTCDMASCRGRTFLDEDELRSHEVIHQDDVRTRALRDGITRAITEAGKGSAEALAPILESMVKLQERLQASNQQLQEALNAVLVEQLGIKPAKPAKPRKEDPHGAD